MTRSSEKIFIRVRKLILISFAKTKAELKGKSNSTAFYLGKDKKSSSSLTRPAFVKNCVKTKKKISTGNPAGFYMHAHRTATNLVRVNL